MKTLKRLAYLIIIIISVFICLEVAKHFTKKLDHWFHDSLENPGDIFSNSDNVGSLEVFTSYEVEANNLPDVIFNKDYLRWKPSNPCAKFPTYRDIRTNNIFWQVLSLNSSTLESLETLGNLYLSLGSPRPRQDYYLFGAYYDSRGPDVKILAMTKGNPKDLYCNVWFDKGIEPKITKTSYHYVWNKEWKWKPHLLNPYLFSCSIPENSNIPRAVSLTGAKCDRVSNLLKVNNNLPKIEEDILENPSFENYDSSEESDQKLYATKSKDFMVCVKGLDFPDDISYKLIEWIELIRLLGADKIHFYILNVHENVAKVLEHYKQVGWVLMEGLSIPGPLNKTTKSGPANIGKTIRKTAKVNAKNRPQSKRFELIPYNDCFYKHREEYKYVILLDVDEIIMPNIGNWKDLLAKVQNANPDTITSTFSLSNAYFFDETLKNPEHSPAWLGDYADYVDGDLKALTEDIAAKTHMLRTLHRTRNITQPSVFVKGFHNASDVVALHNHFPIECARRPCREVRVHEDVARLAHYRSCPPLLGERRCDALRKDYVRDAGILRFRDDLMRNMQRTIAHIGL